MWTSTSFYIECVNTQIERFSLKFSQLFGIPTNVEWEKALKIASFTQMFSSEVLFNYKTFVDKLDVLMIYGWYVLNKKHTFDGSGQSSSSKVMFAGPSGSCIGMTSTMDCTTSSQPSSWSAMAWSFVIEGGASWSLQEDKNGLDLPSWVWLTNRLWNNWPFLFISILLTT